MSVLRKNKISVIHIILFLLVQTPFFLHSQTKNNEVGVLFYNVENLFDTVNDSLKNDEEFLPEGGRHWNFFKYNQKIKNISRVIYESGGWNPPGIIGLCEIENKKVLNDLIWNTGLSNLNYQAIHYESPDLRGIDVALLYREKEFTPLESIPIKVEFGSNTRPTRDILYVFGLVKDSIPLHVFITHFPSRYGGVMETKDKRLTAAKILNDTIRNILKHDTKANLLVMGDFNDNPQDESLLKLTEELPMNNISEKPESLNNSLGTLKHRFEWSIFDQFLISENLLDSTHTISTVNKSKILDYNFLLEKDKNHTGYKPYRTYIGYKFNHGFSDHFPIWMTLNIN